jgi:hypothetical protein
MRFAAVAARSVDVKPASILDRLAHAPTTPRSGSRFMAAAHISRKA